MILQADTRLLYMKDARGSLPLDYVPKQHWDAWKRFLVKAVDVYFPMVIHDNHHINNQQQQRQGPPELTRYAPNSRPLSTPSNSLPNALAAMVAFGKLTPDEARMMASPDDDDDDEYTDDEGDDSDQDTDDDDAATMDSSSSNDDDDVDEDDWSGNSSRSSSEDYDSDEDYDSHNDDDDDEEEDTYKECAMSPDEIIMTGSLLTGKLL
jgi:hypothetical protein